MPATTRFSADASAVALQQHVAGFNDAAGGFVVVAITGLLPTDTVQSCVLTAKRDRTNADPSLFTLTAGGDAPSLNCTLAAAGPSGTVWLATFWVTAAMTALLLTQAQYDSTLTVLRDGVAIERRVQYGALQATVDLRDVNVSAMAVGVGASALDPVSELLIGAVYRMAAGIGAQSPAVAASLGAAAGTTLAVAVENAQSIAVAMDPIFASGVGAVAQSPQVRASLAANVGNALTTAVGLVMGAVAVAAGEDFGSTAAVGGPAQAVRANVAAGTDFAMGVAVTGPALSLTEEIGTGLDVAVADTSPVVVRASGALGVASTGAIGNTGPVAAQATGAMNITAAAAVVAPPGGVTVTAAQSSGHIYSSGPFTSVAAVPLSTYDSDWVDSYSQDGDTHYVAAASVGYVVDSVAITTGSGGRIVTTWQGAGSPTTDQQITADLYSNGSNQKVGLVVRYTSSTALYYLECIGGSTVKLYKSAGGSSIHTYTATMPLDTVVTVILGIVGTTITVTVGAQAPETHTDTSYATGAPGIYTQVGTSPYDGARVTNVIIDA